MIDIFKYIENAYNKASVIITSGTIIILIIYEISSYLISLKMFKLFARYTTRHYILKLIKLTILFYYLHY